MPKFRVTRIPAPDLLDELIAAVDQFNQARDNVRLIAAQLGNHPDLPLPRSLALSVTVPTSNGAPDLTKARFGRPGDAAKPKLMSVPKSILELCRGKAVDINVIKEHFKHRHPQTVYAAIWKLLKDKKLKKTAPGMYRTA